MIRGYFGGSPGRLRPLVIANLSIRPANVAGEVHFLVDTGADSTVLSPRDARSFGLSLTQLPRGAPSAGVGGMTPTVSTEATITLGALAFRIRLGILDPTSRRQQATLRFIPSLLGRDILAHFAVIVEQRTSRVLLLTPEEADALPLP